MELTQVLHMNKGDGENSYAQNSKVQRKIISVAKPVMEEALIEMLSSNYIIPESMGIADLGCSSGPNTMLVVSEILDIVCAKCLNLGRRIPEFRVCLNDLPTNDFNSIFASLPAFYSKLNQEKKGSGLRQCFVSGIAGSFYGRLFPANSLHFVHSSSSLHWLSQVPPGLMSGETKNKGSIYISKSSPQCLLDEYSSQFQRDFSLFLRSRAEEIVPGGRMVLSLMGRRTLDLTTEESRLQWEFLARALMAMVSEGLIEEEKVDSFNAPYYDPSPEELILELQREGSFFMDRLEAFEIDWDGGRGGGGDDSSFCKLTMGDRVANTIRAVVESMIEGHFGGDIMDDLFRRFAILVDDHFSKTTTKYINLVISLIKKPEPSRSSPLMIPN